MISKTLAEFTASLTYDAIPEAVRRRAKYLMLDGTGIALAASTYDFAKATIKGLAALGTGDSEVIGFKTKLPLRDAVLANGSLIHGLDYDDTHLTGVVHITSSCFPTALGVAASLGKSGKDVLTTYVLGVETATRIGMVAKGELNQVGFHPTGVVAAFGGALIAGKLYGLDTRALTMAQGIVLSMASATREYNVEAAWSKRLHPGWAGAAGITSAALAREGFIGPSATYEGQYGLFATHLGPHAKGYDLEAATRDLNSTWETLNVALKPFPAGQLNIACIDAALALVNKHGFKPQDIEHVETLVPQHAVKIVCEPLQTRRHPPNRYAAQFTIPWQVACALIHRKFGLAELERYADPEIGALADKVTYSVDPHTGYPKHFSGAVKIRLKDGRELAHREQINRGAGDNPLSEDDIVVKFMDNAMLAVPRERAEKIRRLILEIDREPDARAVARALAL